MRNEAMAGKVPEPTPAPVQPTPILRLETRIASPKAPVTSAVTTSSWRREIKRRCPSLDPALLAPDAVRAFEVGLDQLLEVGARREGRGLARALHVLLPLRSRDHLAHHVDPVLELIGLDAARQPDGARLVIAAADIEALFL